MFTGGAALLGVVLFWLTAPGGALGVQIGIGAGVIVSLLGSLWVIGGGALLSSPEFTAVLRARFGSPRSH